LRAKAFRQTLAATGVNADTPATVLCDGDAGLWRLQRDALPGATVVLDWWHAAVRFEHALHAARGLERAKWRLWHGRWTGYRRKLAALCRWTERRHKRDVVSIGRLQQRASELLGYLERNEAALVHYAARRRRGESISTAFVESAVGEIIAKSLTRNASVTGLGGALSMV